MGLLFYWPTLLWLLGYIEFWVQLLVGPVFLGVSLWLAVATLLVPLFRYRREIGETTRRLRAEGLNAPLFFKLLLGLTLLLLAIGLVESRHPAHLGQESDALVYHMSIPRQHLLHRSTGPLAWSVADLFPMTLQWGFAPTWFMNETLNKIPQALCAVWLLVLMIALGRKNAEPSKPYTGWIPALAVISTHGIMIQLGTAMMDIPILYCAIAAWHAAQNRRWGWAAINLALFATAKSFSVFQTGLVLVMALSLMTVTQSVSLKQLYRDLRFPSLLFMVFFMILMARSSWVSYQAAGTPIFPFFACLDTSAPGCIEGAPNNIQESAKQHLTTRDAYGNGRSLNAFFKHLWRVSVPTTGVNNEYDYPLGLPWLLGIFFLAVAVIIGFQEKRLSSECAIAIGFWVVWWIGSHQSRWLYPVIAFAWLGTKNIQRMVNQRVLLGALSAAAFFTLISQARSLQTSLLRSSVEIQAQQTRLMARDVNGFVTDTKMLYANEPIVEHHGVDVLWIRQRPDPAQKTPR